MRTLLLASLGRMDLHFPRRLSHFDPRRVAEHWHSCEDCKGGPILAALGSFLGTSLGTLVGWLFAEASGWSFTAAPLALPLGAGMALVGEDRMVE